VVSASPAGLGQQGGGWLTRDLKVTPPGGASTLAKRCGAMTHLRREVYPIDPPIHSLTAQFPSPGSAEVTKV
jgi:hypothetical protein